MKKTTRQLITLSVLIVVLGGLAAAYFGVGAQQERQAAAAAEAEAAEVPAPATNRLISKTESDLLRVDFVSQQGGNFTIESVEDEDGRITWVYAGDHSILLNQSNTRSMMRDIFALNAVETVIESVDNPEEYGIGQVVATAYFRDGEREVVRIGSMTPDHNRFYMMLDGDPALHLINAVAGGRLNQGVMDLVERSFQPVEPLVMTQLVIRERGRDPIEFAFDGTEEEKLDMLHSFNSIWLTMVQPFPGRSLNFQNFERIALEAFEGFNAGEVVELFPDNPARYGFDDPLLEFIIEDIDGNGVHLIFGDYHGDEFIYVMFGDRPHVFLTERRFITGLLGLNPFNFIDRFLYLANIVEVERVVLQSPIGNFDMVLNNFVDEDERDQIAPTVNGEEVQDRAFRTFYQTMIGMVFDLEIDLQEDMGEPDIIITYYKLDENEPPVVVELFAYDQHFYAARRDDEPIQLVISRLTVNTMFVVLESLLAGELDR